MPFEGLLDYFVAATSGVFPDNQEREDRVFDTEAGEVGKDGTSSVPLSGKWTGLRQGSVKQVACTRISWTLKSHLARRRDTDT